MRQSFEWSALFSSCAWHQTRGADRQINVSTTPSYRFQPSYRRAWLTLAIVERELALLTRTAFAKAS